MMTILLVEDNVPVRRGLRRLLEAKGDIKVVAMVDISLPIMDGIEAAVAEAYLGSSGFAVKRTRFGYLPWKFPESPCLDQNAGDD